MYRFTLFDSAFDVIRTSLRFICIMQIHWFSIFNSFMMVVFLTGLVSMILMRTLRNDYAKYAREDDDLETLVMLSKWSECSVVCASVYFFPDRIYWIALSLSLSLSPNWKKIYIFNPPQLISLFSGNPKLCDYVMI